MKRFATFFMAAILGSLCTIGAVEYFKKDNKVALSYMAETPIQHVSYTEDENGREIPLDFTAIAEKATPAVVYIKSIQTTGTRQSQIPEELREFFGQRGPSGPSVSSGSGVIISEGGYIVTNNHVVANADTVEVTLNDNRSFIAEVIGTDPDTDLALIKINAAGLKYLSFVNSDHSRVGEWVVAVGNPFNLTSTVTAGIISAKSRNINIINRRSEEGQNISIESFIQTDAAINPGNSGGALVDMSGGLLGINTAIASNTGSYNGYGFAVPSNIVSKVVEDLIKFGAVQRGWLGVSITSVNSQLAKRYSLELNEGAYVNSFPANSAAKEAGLKEGDVITKINETPIRSSSALIETVGSHRPGDKLNVTVNRKGKEITYPITLKTLSGGVEAVKPADKTGYASLGVELQDMDSRELRSLQLTNGVKIKALNNGKLANNTEVREGFIVTKINDKPVKSVKEFNEVMKSKKAGDLVILTGTYADLPREFNYAFRM